MCIISVLVSRIRPLHENWRPPSAEDVHSSAVKQHDHWTEVVLGLHFTWYYDSLVLVPDLTAMRKKLKIFLVKIINTFGSGMFFLLGLQVTHTPLLWGDKQTVSWSPEYKWQHLQSVKSFSSQERHRLLRRYVDLHRGCSPSDQWEHSAVIGRCTLCSYSVDDVDDWLLDDMFVCSWTRSAGLWQQIERHSASCMSRQTRRVPDQ